MCLAACLFSCSTYIYIHVTGLQPSWTSLPKTQMPGLQRSFSLCIATLMTPPVKYYLCLLAIILGVAYLPPSLLGHGGRSFPKCSCLSMRSKARQRRCYLACRTHVIRGYLIHTYDMPEEPADPEHLRKNLLMRFLCVDDSFIAV